MTLAAMQSAALLQFFRELLDLALPDRLPLLLTLQSPTLFNSIVAISFQIALQGIEKERDLGL